MGLCKLRNSSDFLHHIIDSNSSIF